MKHHGTGAFAWFGAFLFMFQVGTGTGCSGERMLSGTVTDGNGRAVPGAIVYVEAYREGKGTFDFAFRRIDSIGGGAFSFSLKWKRNAKIAYAVVAPGKKIICGFDRTRYYENHDLQIELYPVETGHDLCVPELIGMGFPFEESPELSERLFQGSYKLLLSVLLLAYKPIVEGVCPVPSGYEEKLSAVKGLQNGIVP